MAALQAGRTGTISRPMRPGGELCAEVLARTTAGGHPAGMCLAVPGRLLDVTGEDDLSRMGRVDFGGMVKTVSLACVPEARVGDYVLVHVGMALNVVDAAEAARVLALLDEMGELAELGPEEGAPSSPGSGDPPGRSTSAPSTA